MFTVGRLTPPLLFVPLLLLLLLPPNPNPSHLALAEPLSIVTSDDRLFFHDYSPPSPPPPPTPPEVPSASCDGDLRGTGSLDTLCLISLEIELNSDLYVKGNGSVELLPGAALRCAVSGCSVSLRLGKEIRLGNSSEIVAGSVFLQAQNVSLVEKAVVDASALGGDPPPQTSGVPHGTHGDGGGYGGRGASCFRKEGQSPDDSWGGDAYAWDSLMWPNSYGSRGGTTSREEDYGGGGGGRVRVIANDTFQLDGSVLANGGAGGESGGGGSGGSIYITAQRMKGNGKISASGGNGVAGGGGGRVSINAFSRHDNQEFRVHGCSNWEND